MNGVVKGGYNNEYAEQKLMMDSSAHTHTDAHKRTNKQDDKWSYLELIIVYSRLMLSPTKPRSGNDS